MTRQITERLEILQKRADFLAKRISESTMDRTYDKRELSALEWVIALVRDLNLAENESESMPF